MTHLRIEQNNIQENVSSAVIEKLYLLATSGDLDASSHLAGNLYVPATYLEYIDVLTDLTDPKFRDLTITAGSIYIMFADPEVKRVMATLFGDGTNVSVSNLTGVTTLPANLFRSNSNIHTFNELNNLRGITTLSVSSFEGSSIQQIGLNNITTLGGAVFYNCSSLTGNILLPSISTVGESNFFGCSSLTGVQFANGVLTSIPNNEFQGCTNLTSISGLQNVTSVGMYAFLRCSQLSSCDIDSSKLILVGEHAFEVCSSLTISGNFQNLTTVGFQAFYRLNFTNGIVTCPSITQNELLGWTFKECTMSTIDFTGSTFTLVNLDAISDCSSLTSVTLPSTCTTINREAFRRCTSLNSINLSNVTTLGNLAFADCTSLTSVDVSNVENYGAKALNWTGITRLTLLKLTEIGVEAFNGSQFTYLEFGPNLTSIGIGAFWDSRSLTTLVFRSTTPPTFSDTNRSDKFLYGLWMDACTIYVPDASVSNYLTAWPNMATQITGISNLPQS